MAEIKGYVRPSPFEAGVGPQIEVLKAAGAEMLFEEKLLSGEADRPALRRALDGLGTGDTLLVVSLDRLARTTTELFYILEEIIRRGASLLSLKEGLCVGADDAETHAGLAFMRDLGLIIDFERVSLREWQRESIEGTKARRERGPYGARRRTDTLR